VLHIKDPTQEAQKNLDPASRFDHAGRKYPAAVAKAQSPPKDAHSIAKVEESQADMDPKGHRIHNHTREGVTTCSTLHGASLGTHTSFTAVLSLSRTSSYPPRARGIQSLVETQTLMPRAPYAAVGTPAGNILVECRNSSGNASEIAARILRKLADEVIREAPGRRSYAMGSEGFRFRLMWSSSGYTFVLLERGMGESEVWQLLANIKNHWEARFDDGELLDDPPVTTAATAAFQATLGDLLRAERSPVVDDRALQGADDLGEVHERLEQVRTVMADSIEKVLERGEKIELLIDRAERLEANAVTFAKSSAGLKKSLRWRLLRSRLLMSAALLGGLLLLLVPWCGGVSLATCRAAPGAPAAATRPWEQEWEAVAPKA
jgi:vesicle-associated membrane protein 7